MLMMRARVQGHRWVDHPAAAVMEARVPGQWVDRPAAMVMEAREQGRCWIDHPAAAVMEARVQGRHWVDRPSDQVRAAVSQLPERQQKLVAELKYAMKTSSFLGVTSTSVSALPTNPTEFINLAEGFVRKVIKVAKNIASFKTLQKDDQIWLLKGSVVDIMMLRSLINYDPSTESWSLSTRECLGQKTSPPSSTTTQATSPVNPTSPTTSPTTTTAVAASSVSGPAAASSKDAIGSGGSPGGVSVSGGFPGSLRGSDGLPRGLGCFEGITGMADSGGLPDMTGSCGLPGGTGGSGGLPVMTCSGGLPGGMGGPGNFPGMTGSSCVPGMPCSGFTPETISFGHFTGMSSSGYPGAISPSSKPGELYHSETISYMDVSSSVSPIHDVTSPFSFSLGSMGFDQPESSSSPHCLPHSPEDVSSGGSPFSPPQYFLTTPMSSPGTAASSHLVSSSGLTSPGLEFNPSWPSGETLKASACVDVMPKRLVSTGVMMETSASTGVMMETSASTGMVMETANAPRVTPETSDPTGVSLETSATAGMTSSETSGSNRISAELLKRGSPEMVKLFMNYSRFVGSLMSNIQGDVLVLEVLIMMSLFSADRTTLLAEREKVQAIQEEYASVLQFYTKTRFSEDKSLFARLVMKLADLRDINEVHSKMLLAMKVSELELLLLEIFDL
ncbi:hypothetical protein ACOMHN_050757 [Nucella lapillus]